MKLCAILSILAVFTLTSSSPVFGYVVTVEVEGVVTDVNAYSGLEFDGSVTASSTMTGSCTYDMETPDQGWPDDSGRYSLISISMSIGNYLFLPNLTAAQEPFFVINTWTNAFYYDVVSPEALFYGPAYLNGEPTNLEDRPSGGFRLMYLGADTESPTGDSLPDEDTFPDLSVFTEDNFFDVECSLFRIYGEVTSITVIPEPTTILLFGLGGVTLIRRRRV